MPDTQSQSIRDNSTSQANDPISLAKRFERFGAIWKARMLQCRMQLPQLDRYGLSSMPMFVAPNPGISVGSLFPAIPAIPKTFDDPQVAPTYPNVPSQDFPVLPNSAWKFREKGRQKRRVYNT
jgi:hypothetical protein